MKTDAMEHLLLASHAATLMVHHLESAMLQQGRPDVMGQVLDKYPVIPRLREQLRILSPSK
jgi:hypothetical protein